MATVVSNQTLINHFCNERSNGHGKWLLYSANNKTENVDKRILRLWDASGVDEAAALPAVAEWTKVGRKPRVGQLIDPASSLRVFIANREERYESRYIAFGKQRPQVSVFDTRCNGEVDIATPAGPRKRFSVADKDGGIYDFTESQVVEGQQSAVKGFIPMQTSAEGTNASSARGVTSRCIHNP